MSKVEIDKVIEKIKVCEDIVRPYSHTAIGATILNGLNTLRRLLASPSKENIDRCLSLIERGERGIKMYRHVEAARKLLEHLSELKEQLISFRRKF